MKGCIEKTLALEPIYFVELVEECVFFDENSPHGERKIMTVMRVTSRALFRTSSMKHKKRVLLSLTSPGAVVQPLALEPVALETAALEPVALEPTAADTSNV
jgi:hypothetical protein